MAILKPPALLIWIPGFLGQSQDFFQINSYLSQEFSSDLTFLNLSFFEHQDEEMGDLKNWFWNIEQTLQRTSYGPIFLAGYSLGGRLALHWRKYGSISFQEVFAISTHFGLSSESERAQRQIHDEGWAQRFLKEDWKTLLQDWNTQSVLRGNIFPDRKIENFDRSRLAHALRVWSLGRQESFVEASLPKDSFENVRWIVGGKDQKFRQLFESRNEDGSFSPKAHIDLIEESGHRIPFESPRMLASILAHYIRNSLYRNRDL